VVRVSVVIRVSVMGGSDERTLKWMSWSVSCVSLGFGLGLGLGVGGWGLGVRG